jgi:hypothetical protein
LGKYLFKRHGAKVVVFGREGRPLCPLAVARCRYQHLAKKGRIEHHI